MGRSGGGSGGSHTTEDGVVVSRDLLDGEYTKVLIPKGYAWVRIPFEIRGGAEVDLGDVTLSVGAACAGRVVDSSGHGVGGVSVKCGTLIFDERWTVTDGEGRFTLEHFPPTPYPLTLYRDGWGERTVTVEPEKAAVLEVRLYSLVKVRGTVRWPPGARPSETSIELRRPDAPLLHGHASYDGTEHETTYYADSAWLEVDAAGHFEQTVARGPVATDLEGWRRQGARGRRVVAARCRVADVRDRASGEVSLHRIRQATRRGECHGIRARRSWLGTGQSCRSASTGSRSAARLAG